MNAIPEPLNQQTLDAEITFQNQQILVNALIANDAKAYTHLYINYAAALLFEINRIVRTPEQGEDVLQETFLKISRSLNQFDPVKGRFFTWMARIAKNNAIDSLRSKSERHPQVCEEIGEHMVMLEINHQYLYHPEYMDVAKLIGKLPFRELELIQLIYYKGFSHSEVAEILEIPIGTVKSRWRQAIQNLRKIFKVRVGSA